MARRNVSEARKSSFYLGTILMVLGLILFFSSIVGVFVAVGSGGASDPGAGMMRAPVGFVLLMVGGFLRRVGARGVAGAGLILDPERAREDLEPWSRMGGGMVSDALDEAGIDLASPAARAARPARGGRGDGWGGLPLDERLRRLHALHADGILTDEEYAREKRELLDENG
ncbi:SHOCT domain-containing protein [Engelhardtia mirabilis]|uniref:SHOCT domain-containing protein n=1 Tax=Engelhardtia mirabilis TaxID=2528011 RepID=A0A518BQY3_9BACT|nr:hypothetical protein Pla133_45100 [Planctomycetes bacterium Pla133]QDV03717.1 hypothetical protein Pla86_45080 [Planctomycetes bacterium Pla86]